MKLLSGKYLLDKAYENDFAVGEFNVSNMEVMQAVVEAANEKKSPIIIGVSNGAVDYAGWDFLHNLVEAAAQNSEVPIALHFDHAESYSTIIKAIRNDFTSVMIDASRSDFEENIDLTRQVVETSHAVNCSVEAEVGKIAGLEEDIQVSFEEENKTDPQKALQFVDATGVDYLAVSIGNASGDYKINELDIERVKEINKMLAIPLVLHGGSGVTSKTVEKAIHNGIAKINVDTDLRKTFTGQVRDTLDSDSELIDPRDYLKAGREAVKKEVKDKIAMFGSTDKACLY